MGRFSKSLYLQVLVAIITGSLIGHFAPQFGVALKPFGDAFIKVIKAVIGPLIFLTIVNGIGGVGDLRKLGRVGIKALIYFETLTTVALILGLTVVNVIRPGDGIHAKPTLLDSAAVKGYATTAGHLTVVEFLLNVIPETFVGAFTSGEILPVLFLAILVGVAVSQLGAKGASVLELTHVLAEAMFGIVRLVMRFAPFAALGAMAFTVGKYGLDTLLPLARLMACVYLTSAGFVFLILGVVVRMAGFRLWPLLRYLREEIFLVVGTSSSESALPRLMERMERLGCSKSVVGLVLPAGYSFNLDGTSIYLTMAAVFIAQATDTRLSLAEQLGILGVLLLTSKGAAAVTGGGFVTLAATLAATKALPVAGLTLLLGVDRFMSEARAVTNLIGNAVAVLVISRWENELDVERARNELRLPLGGKPSRPNP
jgi:aerobic C4-dicarboxylate transport protein